MPILLVDTVVKANQPKVPKDMEHKVRLKVMVHRAMVELNLPMVLAILIMVTVPHLKMLLVVTVQDMDSRVQGVKLHPKELEVEGTVVVETTTLTNDRSYKTLLLFKYAVFI